MLLRENFLRLKFSEMQSSVFWTLNFSKCLPSRFHIEHVMPGADLGGGCRGCAPPLPEMTCGFLIQLVFCKKKKLCGLLVLKWSKRRVHPVLKEILDPPPNAEIFNKPQVWLWSKK